MAELGKYNVLKVVKDLDFGLYLDGDTLGEILIPRRYVPMNCTIGEELEVFLYLDSEDRIIATTEQPEAIVGEFALMKVKSVDKIGAFLEWGLSKDLLVPFREQQVKMEMGKSYLVYVYIDDETNRIAASSRIDEFLDNLPVEYEEGEEVDLIIGNSSDLGYKAIINGLHWGMLYRNEVFQDLRRGQHIKGYINKVREDEKIDLVLQRPGYQKVDAIAQGILDSLKAENGFLFLSDKSPAEDIYDALGISKKNFKKAIGALYKQRLIVLEDNGIRLV